jgi:hypothetical protein
MRKLPAVEEARDIMREGTEWGVWKWLLEKKRVRAAADEARATLNELEKKVKAAWSAELKSAYNQLVSGNGNGKRTRSNPGKSNGSQHVDPQLLAEIRRIIEADDEAYTAHEEAEEVFAEAETRMSTSMARDGARKALEAYDLHEAAIRQAEALARSN